MFSNLGYKKYNKKDVIFKKGDPCDNKLYIILSGSVLIFIDNSVDLGVTQSKPQSPDTKNKEE